MFEKSYAFSIGNVLLQNIEDKFEPRISIQSDRILQYFHAKLLVQFFLFKTTILETQLYNVYSENISIFFFFFNIQKFFLIDDYITSKICLAFQVEFGVHFQIDLKKTKVKKEEKSNYCHVALIKLMLGSATLQDFIMICSIN